ncbi:MAG: gas vesicle protein [Chloroflexi bacterium]|nr:gas vesicle protein [Chloroflexota bacterium]
MDRRPGMQHESTSIIDILDRVLDKGLVVAGDISISLANVELLTIRIRLLVCSIDKAEQIGLNWWRYDRNLVRPTHGGGQLDTGEVQRLESRIAELERELARTKTAKKG